MGVEMEIDISIYMSLLHINGQALVWNDSDYYVQPGELIEGESYIIDLENYTIRQDKTK